MGSGVASLNAANQMASEMDVLRSVSTAHVGS